MLVFLCIFFYISDIVVITSAAKLTQLKPNFTNKSRNVDLLSISIYVENWFYYLKISRDLSNVPLQKYIYISCVF